MYSLVFLRYDLSIARADNEVDMRYMINMAYSTDLPINTMGRRVRTRLYFTSESHLHTLLNVLRFAKNRTSVLSEQGVLILNGTSELCYLTQLAIRLFEDNRWELTDPRRFRVEILFSPGATATPLHMHEQDRDSDPSRFDTAPLEMIGREGLTCRELEDFFNEAVMEGATVVEHVDDEEEEDEDLKENEKVPITAKSSNVSTTWSDVKSAEDVSLADTSIPTEIPIVPSPEPVESILEEKTTDNVIGEVDDTVDKVAKALATVQAEEENRDPDDSTTPEHATSKSDSDDKAEDASKEEEGEEDEEEEEDTDRSQSIKNLERKYFWSTVAVGSFMLAASCLVLALNLSDSRRPRRYHTNRY